MPTLPMFDDFDFDNLAPASKPVKFRGKKYTLGEATAEGVRQYRNSIFKATKMTADGKPTGTIGDMADAEPILVAASLTDDSTGKTVPLEELLTWPDRVVKPLYDWVKAHSNFERSEEDKEAVKNSPNGTVAISG